MKKLIFVLLALNICFFDVYALSQNKENVELIKCEAALSSWVKINNQKTRIRLIAMDISDGVLNDEIDSYVCNLLENANNIQIEYDPNFLELDDYNRLNVWVYVDGNNLQSDLISKGYAQVNYINNDYLYLDNLCNIQKDAIKSNLGIWKYPNQEEKYCKSGINLTSTASNVIEEKQIINKKDYSYLYDLISIILFIIVLSLIIRFKRNEYGQR